MSTVSHFLSIPAPPPPAPPTPPDPAPAPIAPPPPVQDPPPPADPQVPVYTPPSSRLGVTLEPKAGSTAGEPDVRTTGLSTGVVTTRRP